MSSASYTILFTRSARKNLDQLDRQLLRRIAPIVDSLALEPRPAGCLKVKTEEGIWRVRVGDWRIGYEIDDTKREVTIIRIGHRSEFYD